MDLGDGVRGEEAGGEHNVMGGIVEMGEVETANASVHAALKAGSALVAEVLGAETLSEAKKAVAVAGADLLAALQRLL
jgi:hypothetical protein